MARDLTELDIKVLMLDGEHLAERCVVVALAITADGTKMPVGLWDGSTENKTVVRALLADLVDRGLNVRPPQRLRSSVGRRMTDAYHASSALQAEAALLALAKELDRTHPGAAANPREGLDETLTVLRLNDDVSTC